MTKMTPSEEPDGSRKEVVTVDSSLNLRRSLAGSVPARPLIPTFPFAFVALLRPVTGGTGVAFSTGVADSCIVAASAAGLYGGNQPGVVFLCYDKAVLFLPSSSVFVPP